MLNEAAEQRLLSVFLSGIFGLPGTCGIAAPSFVFCDDLGSDRAMVIDLAAIPSTHAYHMEWKVGLGL